MPSFAGVGTARSIGKLKDLLRCRECHRVYCQAVIGGPFAAVIRVDRKHGDFGRPFGPKPIHQGLAQ